MSQDRRITALDRLIAFYETHGWCRGTLARTKQRKPAYHRDAKATSFCFLGACTKEGISSGHLQEAFFDAGLAEPVAHLNDARGTKASAVKLLKDTRAKLLGAS